jgi:predicted DsbA family dithiol-disulfide isomerase
MARFKADMQAPATQKRIMEDMRNAEAAEVRGTPTIFINGWLYRGQRTPTAIQQVVDQEVAKLAASKKK